MRMPASPEFIALCRSQVTLLTQGLGASLTVVYRAEALTDDADTSLTPVIAYPEAAADWDLEQLSALLLEEPGRFLESQSCLTSASSRSSRPALLSGQSESPAVTSEQPAKTSAIQADNSPQKQVIVPLIHEGIVMGLLVTGRSDRSWNQHEQDQIERIAHTLAIASVMDQRGQWLEHETQQHRLLQAQQTDLFDLLLHQFRNPLTALRTFGKLLMKRFLPDDPNRELAVGIVRESDRLQDLLREFDTAVDLGRADLLSSNAGTDPKGVTWEAQVETDVANPRLLPSAYTALSNPEIPLEARDLKQVLHPLLQSSQAIAADRQLALIAAVPTDLPPVHMDERALREVLSNLLDNALKYTPTGGIVAVGVVRVESNQGMQQAIAIADNGPGIPPEDLTHLFEPHYRGVQAQTNIPGTGLGLAIARALIAQMQGDIQVFSPARQSNLLGLFGDRFNEANRAGTVVVVYLPETIA